MSFAGSVLGTAMLLNGLLDKDPGSLTIHELDKLQQFTNKGRSLVLLREHPQLEGIFSLHAFKHKSENVVDIVLCFLEEGGSLGSQRFTKLVEQMIKRELVSPAIIDVLVRNRFLLPGPIPNYNQDGVIAG